MRKLKWKQGMTAAEKRLAVETARYLGFQSESYVYPMVSDTEGAEIPSSLSALAVMAGREEEEKTVCVKADGSGVELPEDYVDAGKGARPVSYPDFRKETGLELFFTGKPFLKDQDMDMLPDAMDVKFVIPADAPDALWRAACEFAFRFGMETTAYEESLAAEEDWQGNAVIFRDGTNPGIYYDEKPQPGAEGRTRIVVEGRGEELAKLTELFCMKFPLLPEGRTWQECLTGMAESFAMKNLNGEMAAVLQASADKEVLQAYVSPEFEEERIKYESEFPDCTFFSYKTGKTVYEKTYEFPWEKDVLETILREKVYPVLNPGDKVEIQAAISEDTAVRSEICQEMRQAVVNRKAVPEKTEILCAYKQGFSWLREIVLPRLQAVKAAQVEIAFKPFLPEGETVWQDEYGATPSYHNLQDGQPDKWYDLPVRFLQELYPIEDVLVKGLEIPREQVSFTAYEGTEELNYLCTAKNEAGEEVFRDTCLAAYDERPYLDEFPGMGKVHPSTGYVKVKVKGAVLVDERIKTDLEYIWDAYQNSVLPDCRRYVEEKFGDRISEEIQPFFNELRIEVEVSEPDEALDSREDMISSLDALHEDLYFAGADYFKNFGNQKTGALLDAPGLILPVIHQCKGNPRMRVSLKEQLRQTASVEADGQVLFAPADKREVNVWISGIRLEKDQLNVEIATEADPGMVKAYAELMEKGLLEKDGGFDGIGTITWKTGDEVYQAEAVHPEDSIKDLDICEIDFCDGKVIGYEEYMEIIRKLRRVPGLRVFCAARSYLGRKIYAIELLPEREGYVSRVKRLTNHPSAIINTRHHANEVSGTNAMILLLRRILTEKTYQKLPDSLNLVMVPMENPDGAAIHYELQKEHPRWKLHVARFSAIGKEFSRGYFKEDTIHREANAVTRLFYRCLPDIFVDNHGVPSHEWEQQFSGYTSPSYKGFWLPRSLLYGYFWYVTEPEYQSNYKLNKVMEDRIADRIAADERMKQWNCEWTAQFETYAHGWMPKLFPADYYKDMINYWIPFSHTPGHHYTAVSFPWITSVSYTSEVADETAQGAYLRLCAEAHAAHDEATIEMLAGAGKAYRRQACFSEEQISVRDTRLRPVVAL